MQQKKRFSIRNILSFKACCSRPNEMSESIGGYDDPDLFNSLPLKASNYQMETN